MEDIRCPLVSSISLNLKPFFGFATTVVSEGKAKFAITQLKLHPLPSL